MPTSPPCDATPFCRNFWGWKKIVSEDAVRRGLKAIEEEEGAAWLRRHLGHCLEPLLNEPWILDVDTTIKPLYGHQEGAELGYNPKKPGRPSHCHHSYAMAQTRLVLDVDVRPGAEHTCKPQRAGLWALLDRLPRDGWPALLRGDASFGVEPIKGRSRGARGALSVQAAADGERQTHDREARGSARVG